MNLNDPLTQHELKARAHEVLDKLIEGHAKRGYFGTVGVVIELRDGTVTKVRGTLDQAIKQ